MGPATSPVVQRLAREVDPSLLPNQYGWTLVTTVALVAAAAALWGLWIVRRKRSGPAR